MEPYGATHPRGGPEWTFPMWAGNTCNGRYRPESHCWFRGTCPHVSSLRQTAWFCRGMTAPSCPEAPGRPGRRGRTLLPPAGLEDQNGLLPIPAAIRPRFPSAPRDKAGPHHPLQQPRRDLTIRSPETHLNIERESWEVCDDFTPLLVPRMMDYTFDRVGEEKPQSEEEDGAERWRAGLPRSEQHVQNQFDWAVKHSIQGLSWKPKLSRANTGFPPAPL